MIDWKLESSYLAYVLARYRKANGDPRADQMAQDALDRYSDLIDSENREALACDSG